MKNISKIGTALTSKEMIKFIQTKEYYDMRHIKYKVYWIKNEPVFIFDKKEVKP